MSGPAIESVEVLYQGWGRLLMAKVRLADGVLVDRQIEDHGEAAAVLPYDPDRRVATLVRQVRPAILQGHGVAEVIEVPAGILDEDDPAACAKREASEEVGLALREVELVAAAWAMPGVSTERIHLYLGRYSQADRTGEGGGVSGEHENITVLELPLSELARMADENRLPDLKTLLLVQSLRLRRPDLFA